jgi:hypothetical protein
LAVEVSSDAANLCPDRLHQAANAQNADHPFHVVGQDVQRHFGCDILERFHLEVRGSHPRLYRTEGMLDSLAALTHLGWVPVEPSLYSLKDGFVLPSRYPPLLPVVHLLFSAQA